MNNIQFATAIHILTLLALTEGNASSGYIAGSIGINPAMVRKSLGSLSKNGLIITREGKGGGISLAKPPTKILLSDIYDAVNQTPLLGRSNKTNPGCPVGKQINNHLKNLYLNAENALLKELGNTNLADFCKKFN